jgi:hypothetical protein
MTEHPIIFNTQMVKAILEGRKTMTRRLNGLEKFNVEPDIWRIGKAGVMDKVWWEAAADSSYSYRLDCPYGQVGDRLWVRETFAIGEYFGKLFYKEQDAGGYGGNWMPSIHMPRWASRITLEITELRVERLQEIGKLTHDECAKEGWPFGFDIAELNEHPVATFKRYWDFLNAKRGYGWDTNCWVWVIGFKVVTPELLEGRN